MLRRKTDIFFKVPDKRFVILLKGNLINARISILIGIFDGFNFQKSLFFS